MTRAEDIHNRRWAILGVLCLSLFVIVMDNTIVNVALPSLVRELGATTSQLQWIVDSYTLVFAGLLLSFGALGDRFGRKGALTSGMAIFGLASFAAALSTSAGQLIAARAVMGVGAALIMPATLSILTNVFTIAKERAGRHRAVVRRSLVSRSRSDRSRAASCSTTSRGARCSWSTCRSSSEP